MSRSAVEVKAQLRSAGLRATSARAAVYECLAEAARPMTHAEVCEALEGQGFDRATVYRNLADLTDVELVRRTDHGDHLWRFELGSHSTHHAPDPHPHFVCTECGTVECMPEIELAVRRARAPRAVRARQVEVHVRGLCDSCI